MTFVAIFVGLFIGNVVKPGVGVDLSMADEDIGLAKPHFGLKSEIEKIIPDSFYKAASNNETLQVVFCACMFAVGILLCPNKKAAKSMLDFCYGLSLVMFKVTELIMNFVPIAIAGAIAQTIAKNGIGVLVNLGKLIGCVYVGLSIFLVILTGVLLLTKTNIISFLKTVWEPLMIAFATASSEAAMPLAMEKMVQFGVPSEIVAFVIPTGYTFNLDGTTLYLGAAAIFAMQAGNVDKTIGEQIQMMIMLMLMAKGVAAVPRASLVVLAAGCEQFGLPTTAVAVILGVDAILDMARTSVNLLGNCVACVVVAKWEGKLVAGGIKINEQDCQVQDTIVYDDEKLPVSSRPEHK